MRARQAALIAAAATIVLFAVGGVVVSTIDGYRIVGEAVTGGASEPARQDGRARNRRLARATTAR